MAVYAKIIISIWLFEKIESRNLFTEFFPGNQINRIFHEFKFIFPTLLDPFRPLKIL